MHVATVGKLVAAMRMNPQNVRYDDLHRVCEHYFGPATQNRRLARGVQDPLAR